MRGVKGSPDIFLGWGEIEGRQFYVRQLADMKGSIKFTEGKGSDLPAFHAHGALCGWALVLAHAKSGDPAMIAGYCGTSDALANARRSGRIHVASEAVVK